MNINDIMTDGKLDGQKMYSVYNDFKELADAINAHIAGMKQSTPITPELLKRAGFKGFLDGFQTTGCVVYKMNGISIEFNHGVYAGGVYYGYKKLPHIKTMQELSEFHRFYTGQPLNWQHDQAAEVRKRLEAMGFDYTGTSQYLQNVGLLAFVVNVRKGEFSECFISGRRAPIKSLEQLERVLKELKCE